MFSADSCHSNEREFLRDLVTARPGTSGARLAGWLQPEPRLEPTLTETACGGEPLRCGWPAAVTVTTRDQHGLTAYTAGLQVRRGAHRLRKHAELGWTVRHGAVAVW